MKKVPELKQKVLVRSPRVLDKVTQVLALKQKVLVKAKPLRFLAKQVNLAKVTQVPELIQKVLVKAKPQMKNLILNLAKNLIQPNKS
jgi:hypothetical protein